MTVDEEKRKCSFIHSFPTSVYVCVCAHSCHCVYVYVNVWVCVSRMNTAQWLLCVKSLTASLWLVRTGRQHHPGEGEKRTETGGTGQVYCGAGPRQSSSWWREGWWWRGQLLSPLMSLRFFHQLSIYGAVLHSCTDCTPLNIHPHTPTQIPVTHTQFEAVVFLAGDSQE